MRLLVLVFAVVSASQPAVSKNQEKGKASVAEKKTRVLGNIDKRIDSLNQFKTCVSAVKDDDKGGVKKCREANKERMKKIKDERKAEKK